jgi:hypothetical protein
LTPCAALVTQTDQVETTAERAEPVCAVQKNEESELRKLSSNMTAGDAIKRILLAAKDRDFFRQGRHQAQQP